MDHENGLVAGYILDGNGGGRKTDWKGVKQWNSEQGILWTHFDRSETEVRKYLTMESGLDSIIASALLEEETRPRTLSVHNGMLIVLRGVNLNPGADPEDMVAIRMWVDDRRIISLRKRRLLSIADMIDRIESGNAPCTTGEFITDIADTLVERMAMVVENIDDVVDELQDKVIGAESYKLRTDISRVRRETISLRRYLAPQRDAISRLTTEKVDWLGDSDRMKLREIADRTTRYVEDLDSARERAAVTQEELIGKLSEQMDKRMYLLSIVAAVFLPLGFLTGLLGINVGGIPGAEFPWAFTIVTIGMGVIVLAQLLLFKYKKWM